MINKRHTNLDLLRILSMLMVVIIHSFGWGGLIDGSLLPGHYNWYGGNILHSLSLQAVNCFVLISSYFYALHNSN
jgi:surface polysaccharide O-acyltransferase-like enzyme